MICRMWHGYTAPDNADAYEQLLRSEVITGIEERAIEGFGEIQVLRRDQAGEVEFVTIMWFESIDSVRQFAGEDHEVAVVPPAAQRLLLRYDAHSQHYDVRDRRAQ